jgi:phosphoribosylformylglycinamidine synthase subunit PurSL
MTRAVTVLSVAPRTADLDSTARSIIDRTRDILGIDPGIVSSATVYTIAPALADSMINSLLTHGLGDTILQTLRVGQPLCPGTANRFIAVDRLPGVTDDRASTLSTVLSDLVNDANVAHTVHVRDVVWVESALEESQLQSIAERVIGNPLIQAFCFGPTEAYTGFIETAFSRHQPTIETIPLEGTKEDLCALSKARLWSLSHEEMTVIAAHFNDPVLRQHRIHLGLSEEATDVELEILAQTWSEHCKHKEFRALIQYVDRESEQTQTIDSLFRTYIEGATKNVAQSLEKWGHTWLLKVFNDNAGVVRYDRDHVFVWKVETHNSPSALDPYGGAITGILGNNRDPFGTGIGGGRLLFNTNVLCFGNPDSKQPLLPGQLHPRRVLRGVRKGIEDGGNQSGIPTVNGAIVFDDRFAGKPLVYCGTGSLAPDNIHGRTWWDKPISPGDRIVMAGGRVGKDGIHGATFSSTQLDETSPQSAVQIGSPITQKLLFDFLDAACQRNLIKCSTDNGAGGLSSSVGELASLVGGADVDTDLVPLKYPGLDPWEIFVSESQERMTLVVEPQNVADLLELAQFYEVEATDIGSFTNSEHLIVRHAETIVASLPLAFLHDGVPRKELEAEWIPPHATEPIFPESMDHNRVLEGLLNDLNICSREPVIRQYDHEVQAGTVIKPLMGPAADGPQDAAVLQPDPGSVRGIAVSNGIAPQYGDLDPYHSAAGAFDEAVRQIIAIGGRLPGPCHATFWSVNDNFCVPNVVYDPVTNPDGKHKLAALVRMCQATYDVATAYAVPLTSGKDSMKNDFHAGGQTISVPPTVLFSATAGIPDIRNTVTSDFKAAGDRIYLVGSTYDEMGASAFYRLLGELGANVPRVRTDEARDLYERVSQATAAGLIASCHDLSEGGLAVALAESAMGGRLGCTVSIDALCAEIGLCATLYSESHSRFLATVQADHADPFERLLGDCATFLGDVTATQQVLIQSIGQRIVDIELALLIHAWGSRLEEVL